MEFRDATTGCLRVSPILVWLLWWIPTAMIAIGAFVPRVRNVLWIPAFVVMGLGCIWAATLGYVHCLVTAPVFLLGALATILDARRIRRIDWRLTLAFVLAGYALGNFLEWHLAP